MLKPRDSLVTYTVVVVLGGGVLGIVRALAPGLFGGPLS
jgi:hypothetical protein